MLKVTEQREVPHGTDADAGVPHGDDFRSGRELDLHSQTESRTVGLMIDEETLAQMNGKYVCPPDAGPAWRDAMAAGIDMSLIEHSLTLTPDERLAEHQQVIDFLLIVQEAGSHGAE